MRVALYQGPEHQAEVVANLAAIARAAHGAAKGGAGLLVCAELATTGYHIGRLAHERAEAPDGPIAREIAQIARRCGLAVAYGYPERAAEGVYNSTQVVDAAGRRLANYRKCHLYGELDRSLFLPGRTGVVQLRLGGLTLGLLTCYDVEFPEAVRAHAVSGTELLVVPTGLMVPYEKVGSILVPARAYESQVFVAYANRTGVEGDVRYCGLSCVIAPDGAELARAGRGEEVIVADVERDALLASRAVNTYLRDRRPDLYAAALALPVTRTAAQPATAPSREPHP